MANTNYAKYTSITSSSSTGTVTSVGLADGSTVPLYSISGSPVTTAGTLTFTLQTQVKNLVLAGPATGSNAQPTFRALVAADLPTGNLTDAGTDGITIGNGTGSVIGSGTTISQHVADSTHNGYLSSTDWTTFNSKQAALTIGNLTDAGTDGITIGNGTGSVIGSGTTITQHVADASHNGYLSSTDWTTFNNKFNLPSLTSGSVLFSNGTTIAQDNSNFFWDATNHRLGLGTTTPQSLLTIGGSQSGNAGLEIAPGGGVVAQSFNRTGGVYTSLSFDGSTETFRTNAANGTAITFKAVTATVLNGTFVAAKIDVSTSYTATNFGVTGLNVTLPASTNTDSGTRIYNGISVTPGAIIQNTAAGTNTWNGINVTMPDTTQTTGTVTSRGISITGGTVTSGTAYALTTASAAGNVGIGTITPTAKIHVFPNVNSLVGLKVQGDNNASSDIEQWQNAAGTVLSKVANDGTISAPGLITTSSTTFTQIATPSNPAASSDKLYFKSDNNLYSLTSGGVETKISGGGAGKTGTYWAGNFDTTASWSTTSSTYVDPTVNVVGTFTQTSNSGFGTVTRAASNLPGITFTPTSSSNVYLVNATPQLFYSGPNGGNLQLTDGSIILGNTGTTLSSGNSTPALISAIYAPGTTSPVTIKFQLAVTTSGTIGIETGALLTCNVLTFTIVQIA